MNTQADSTIEHCHSMADVRRNIDALAERSAYVAQAARIKQRADQVYDQARIDFIIDRVRAQARRAGAPEVIVEAAYRAMIAASIEFERGEFTRLRQEA